MKCSRLCMWIGSRLMQGEMLRERSRKKKRCLVHRQHTMTVKIEITAVLLGGTSLIWGSETSLLLLSLVSEGYYFSSTCWPEQRVHARHNVFQYVTNSIRHGSHLSFAMQTRNKACKGQATKGETVGEGAKEWEEWRTQEMEWETQGIAKTIMTSTNCVSYGRCECGDISVLCLSVKRWAN